MLVLQHLCHLTITRQCSIYLTRPIKLSRRLQVKDNLSFRLIGPGEPAPLAQLLQHVQQLGRLLISGPQHPQEMFPILAQVALPLARGVNQAILQVPIVGHPFHKTGNEPLPRQLLVHPEEIMNQRKNRLHPVVVTTPLRHPLKLGLQLGQALAQRCQRPPVQAPDALAGAAQRLLQVLAEKDGRIVVQTGPRGVHRDIIPLQPA